MAEGLAGKSLREACLRCPECGSERLYRAGFRYTIQGPVQRWECRDCGYRFSRKQTSNKCQTKYEDSEYAFPGSTETKNSLRALTAMKEIVEKTDRPAGATDKIDVKGKILEFLWYLKKQGRSEDTILNRRYMLETLVKFGANLFDPEDVKDKISRYPNWKKPSSRAQAVHAYSSFLEFLGLWWKPPKYKPVDSFPFIPLEKELDTLIQNSGNVLAAFLRGLKDTGADPGELAGLKWIDVNPQSKTVAINSPVKGHNARILKVSDEFLARIKRIPKRTDGRIFAHVKALSSNMVLQRRRIAHAYGNPRLLKITFRTFRHWKGTMEYHKTHDPYHVKKLLGHKRLQSTEIYINLEQAVFTEENDEFHVKAVKTLEEACKLIEVGFEYVTDIDDCKIFRKRK